LKTCFDCKNKKPFSDFSKDVKSKDGYQGRCKACFKVKNRERYLQQGEKIRAQVRKRAQETGANKAYYEANRTYWQTRYQENKEEISKRQKEYAKANPEVRKAIKSRYRSKLVHGMSRLDRKKSVLYRKRIKDQPCVYCGKYSATMHDDHFYPLSRGGTDHWFNLVRACSTCNQEKGAKLGSKF
jgi:5-methylcytosine-specific restriction endonuclease McrA